MVPSRSLLSKDDGSKVYNKVKRRSITHQDHPTTQFHNTGGKTAVEGQFGKKRKSKVYDVSGRMMV